MSYRSESEGVPRVAVSIAFADEDWYKKLSRRATPMIQLDEKALVAAGMSMLWVPRDPRAYPVYAHKGKVRYSLMNVFNPKVAGGMDVAALPEEELILLSSEESAGSSQGLIHHSSRAGPQHGPVQEPAGEGASTPHVMDPTRATYEQKETRKKKREEKKTEEKRIAEEPASAPTRKRSSNVNLLDYVVESDSLSSLDAGVKRSAPDPDDDVTLTEMIAKKQKILEDKNKLNVMGEIVAPSESEVDLGVFNKKSCNLLEKIFKASYAPRGMILYFLWLIFCGSFFPFHR
ncbi:hypothetical protein Hanom_Chr11g01054391 [Helianthus anomalus]